MKTRRPFWNKMFRLKPRTLFFLITILVICGIAAFCFASAKIVFTKNQKNDEISQSMAPSVNQNSNTSTANVVSANSDTAPSQNETVLEKIAPMPILMYHYIREVADPNDKIGINLSVSPNKFASQLDLILAEGYHPITFLDIEANSIPEKPIILTFDDGYKDFFETAYPELKKRNMKAVSFIITNDIGKDQYMNESEIKEISKNGIEIGSHTLSHPDLSKLANDKANKEISDSKKTLEDLTGGKVISFCYPSGKYSSETETSVKTAGYKYAVTTNGGITKFDDLFALNRYRMNHDTNISAYSK